MLTLVVGVYGIELYSVEQIVDLTPRVAFSVYARLTILFEVVCVVHPIVYRLLK